MVKYESDVILFYLCCLLLLWSNLNFHLMLAILYNSIINDVIMVIELHLIMFGSEPFARQLSGTTDGVVLNLQLKGAYNYMR